MSDIETNRDFNGNIFSSYLSEADLQLVVGADDLQAINREIDYFQANTRKTKITVTSPGPRFTGAIRFGARRARRLGMTASIEDDSPGMSPRLVVEKPQEYLLPK